MSAQMTLTYDRAARETNNKSPYTRANPSYNDRFLHLGSPYTRFGSKVGGMVHRNESLSPYTVEVPRYDGRHGSGNSPYTNFGPR